MTKGPGKRNSYAREVLKVTSKWEERADELQVVVELINRESERDPFIGEGELKQRVCEEIRKVLKLSDVQSVRLYNGARHVVVPFFASGVKMAQMDAQLDWIGRKLTSECYKKVYDREGVVVGEEINPSALSVAVSAISAKANLLLKSQKNVIDAQREVGKAEQGRDQEIDIERSDREELERYISGELMERPEMVEQLLKSGSREIVTEFYET